MNRFANIDHVIAVNDAYRIEPYPDVIYGSDYDWWQLHGADVHGLDDSFFVREGSRERWTCVNPNPDSLEKWMATVERWDLRVVDGSHGATFELEKPAIHYGNNSGFAAINLALQFGATEVWLLGFDMNAPTGKKHFFGDHPPELGQADDKDYRVFIGNFVSAAAALPDHIRIVNATPGSALTCFEKVNL